MEFLLSFFFYFLRWEHPVGFSHRPQKGWNRLFVVSEKEGVEVYINGYPTGLQAPCLLYLHPNMQDVDLALQAPDRSFSHQRVSLVSHKTFLQAAID